MRGKRGRRAREKKQVERGKGKVREGGRRVECVVRVCVCVCTFITFGRGRSVETVAVFFTGVTDDFSHYVFFTMLLHSDQSQRHSSGSSATFSPSPSPRLSWISTLLAAVDNIRQLYIKGLQEFILKFSTHRDS